MTELVRVNNSHAKLDHFGLQSVLKTASKYNWSLVDKAKKCEPRALAEVNQKHNCTFVAVSMHAAKQGERQYLDTSFVSAKHYSGKQFWELLVDEYLVATHSTFRKQKNDHATKALEDFQKQQSRYLRIEAKRCGSVGRNNAIQAKYKAVGIGIIFV